MKLVGKYVVISKEDLNAALREAENKAKKTITKRLEEEYADKFEQQEKTIKARNKTIQILREQADEAETDNERKIEQLEATIEVLQEDRDNVRDVAKKEMENDDRAALLDAKKEGLDKRAAAIKAREAELDTEEEAKNTSHYADGLADGLRKAHEITQKDRENSMKIAMIAASSHTPVANLKELNSEHQITAGSTDSES